MIRSFMVCLISAKVEEEMIQDSEPLAFLKIGNVNQMGMALKAYDAVGDLLLSKQPFHYLPNI